MKHSVYLIDYENTSYKGLFGIGSIQQNDEIIIFYSDSIETIKDILSAYPKIKYFHLEETGKNALDFMITAYIGYYASKKNISRIAVISKDKGYTSIKPVIDDINSDIELCFENCIHDVIFPDEKTDTEEAELSEKAKKQQIYQSQKDWLLNLIKSENLIAEKYINGIANIILKFIDDDKEFNAKLNNTLGSKSENQKYKQQAKKYYDKMKKLYKGDMKNMMTILYEVGENLYVNITNRCPCSCTFCIRKNGDGAYGSDSLWLDHEPSEDEIKSAFDEKDLSKYKEIVFCGYGEPLQRPDTFVNICRYIKEKDSCPPIRLNTNGLADLINGKPVAPMLEGCADIVSISLNAGTPEGYYAVTRPSFKSGAYESLLNFATECKKYVPKVMFTVVDVISEEEINLARQRAESMDIEFRVRKYDC